MKKIALLLSLLLVICIVGCTLPDAETDVSVSQADKEILAIGLKGPIVGIYPDVTAYESTTIGVNFNMFTGLVEFDKDYRIAPALAESWENLDELTWRFNLRDDVKFHNGNDFTAEDVKYSFELIKNNPDHVLYEQVAMIDEITVVGPYTVDIKTTAPAPVLLYKIVDVYMLSKEYEESGENEFSVGTGAYKLAEYVPEDHVTMTRFDDYWGKKPIADTVVFRFISNDTERTQALLDDDLDIVEFLPMEDIEVSREKGKEVILTATPRIMFLGFDFREDGSNCAEDSINPLSDVRVRRAIYHAIDENYIVENIMEGYAQQASQFIPQSIFGYNPNITRLTYDPEKAKELLAEAGYPNGFSITMDCPNDRYLNDAQICEYVVEKLSEVGIDVDLSLNTRSVFFAKKNSRQSCFFLMGWSADADGGEIYEYFLMTVNTTTDTPFYNHGYYSNPRVDELGKLVLSTVDPVERLSYMQEGFAIAADEVVWIPLHSEEIMYGSSPDIVMKPRTRGIIKIEDIELKE
ncbi:ABC transporter substrate-binding protein [Candidatus Woesearchaeota archaeon]|nr:ABC transporter substrate-binding protein [Candidatus Woesearchaeota archaeon]